MAAATVQIHSSHAGLGSLSIILSPGFTSKYTDPSGLISQVMTAASFSSNVAIVPIPNEAGQSGL